MRYAELKKLALECQTTSARSSRSNSIDEGPGVVTGAFGGALHPVHQPAPTGGRIDIPFGSDRPKPTSSAACRARALSTPIRATRGSPVPT